MNHSRRRALLSILGLGLYVCVGAGCRNGTRGAKPRQGKLLLGSPESFKEGLNYKAVERVAVFRDSAGLAVVSMVCTHQECLLSPSPSGFLCSCHGAQFSKDGVVVTGPAKDDLDWYELRLTPEHQVEVDFSQKVSKSWRLSIPTLTS